MNNISNEYFDWLCGLIKHGCPHTIRQYKKLLQFLHSIEFVYSIVRDSNRYEDGINMRYLFCVRTGVPQYIAASEIDDKPCSVFEMLVALADRCESQIMSDSVYGDRTGLWFWEMIDSLGLTSMYGNQFNSEYCKERISLFLNRAYSPTGEGGLFRVEAYDHGRLIDLTTQEIWYQAMWHLNDVLAKEKYE